MLFTLYLLRHNLSFEPKRVVGTVVMVGGAGYFYASFCVLAHQGRYVPIAIGSVIYAWSLWQHEFGRVCLSIFAATIFISLGATIEITAWNRELRDQHLSSVHDDCDVTQFPLDKR